MNALVRINPGSISLPTRTRKGNPRRRRKGKGRRRNPGAGTYTKAAGEVFIPPLAFASAGALVGMLVASVAKPERIRYSAGFGAITGLVLMGVLATDARAHGK